ncbi:MAG: DUF692 domain-containing protein [Niveispirillum sp.]|uniref:MNIO family bufferin maturase n=1 Tax=Niveispirillum sp. TaxID=1917217 RepID=UPI003BA7B967
MHAPSPPSPDLVKAGIGLRHAHMPDFLAGPQKTGWLEVHAENYLVAGGPRLAQLEKLRQDYPVSFHSVALSLGAADGVDKDHLARLRALYDRFQPAMVSDHLAWTGLAGTHIPDLLPLPLTGETLDIVATNVSRAQDALGRRLLVENPSLYLRFTADQMDEGEFLAALAVRTGCGLLLDLNNLYVSASNRGLDAVRLLTQFPGRAIAEIHLAGHARVQIDGSSLLIDDHGSAVPDPVWALYDIALRRFGPRPTLVEWDTALPPLPLLLAQAAKADAVREAATC